LIGDINRSQASLKGNYKRQLAVLTGKRQWEPTLGALAILR